MVRTGEVKERRVATPRFAHGLSSSSPPSVRKLRTRQGRRMMSRWQAMNYSDSIFKQPKQLQTCVRDLAARSARAVHLSLAPMEGVGNAGCPLHPRPRVHFVLVERTRVTTSTPESPGIPARNGFTAYVGLSPVTGLFCHRRLADIVLSLPGWADRNSAKLDASVGASGPHDFAVREKRLSSACC